MNALHRIGDEAVVLVFWCTRAEAEDTFAALWKHRHNLAKELGPDVRFVLHATFGMLRDMRMWSDREDLARVTRERCRDLKPLGTAADRVLPSGELVETLWHIIDATASGYWGGHASDVEEYIYTAEGWDLVSERGEEGS